jgi:hypothetical protein
MIADDFLRIGAQDRPRSWITARRSDQPSAANTPTGISHQAFTFAMWAEQRGHRQRQRNGGCPAPVVADDEVVPERARRPEPPAQPVARPTDGTARTPHRAPLSGPGCAAAGAAVCGAASPGAAAVAGAVSPGAAARPRRSSRT